MPVILLSNMLHIWKNFSLHSLAVFNTKSHTDQNIYCRGSWQKAFTLRLINIYILLRILSRTKCKSFNPCVARSVRFTPRHQEAVTHCPVIHRFRRPAFRHSLTWVTRWSFFGVRNNGPNSEDYEKTKHQDNLHAIQYHCLKLEKSKNPYIIGRQTGLSSTLVNNK